MTTPTSTNASPGGCRGSAGSITSLFAAAIFLGAVCPVPARSAQTAVGLTFAAHETHAGLVIDQMGTAAPVLVAPEAGWHWGEPTFVLHDRDATEELRVTSPARVVVQDPQGRRLGTVEPSWDDNALRLTLHSASGPPLQSDVFHRVNHGAGPSVLTRQVQETLELRGAYEAPLRRPDGSPAGWLRLTLGEDQPGHVLYEGVLPTSIDEGMAAATAEALASEVGWIESHSPGVSRRSGNRP
jgi:hypothetical protein